MLHGVVIPWDLGGEVILEVVMELFLAWRCEFLLRGGEMMLQLFSTPNSAQRRRPQDASRARVYWS